MKIAAKKKTSDTKGKSFPNIMDREPKMDPKDFRFDELAFSIYQDMPYLGYILSSIRRVRVEDLKTMPSLAIDPQNRLYYNPHFLVRLNLTEQKGVLLHEVLHKAHHHFHRADQILQAKFGIKNAYIDNAISELDPIEQVKIMRHHQLFNITMDCAINQLISKKFKLPEDLISLESIQSLIDDPKIVLEADREFEYYFQMLLSNNAEIDDAMNAPVHVIQYGDGKDSPDGNGSGEAPDGVVYEEASNEIGEGKDGEKEGSGNSEEYKSDEQHNQEFKHIIRKANQKQREYEAARGIGKGHNDSLIDILPNMEIDVTDKKVWEALVNKGFGDHQIPNWEPTMKRPSRRIRGNPFGQKRQTGSKHVVVVVDTSGSLSTDEVEKFFGCINRAIRRYKVTVDLLLVTTVIYKTFLNVRKLSGEHVKISSGGTDMTVAQKWIMDNKPKKGRNEHMVILTDGYTDWIQNVPFSVAAIYTKDHSPLKGVTNSAVLS